MKSPSLLRDPLLKFVSSSLPNYEDRMDIQIEIHDVGHPAGIAIGSGGRESPNFLNSEWHWGDGAHLNVPHHPPLVIHIKVDRQRRDTDVFAVDHDSSANRLRNDCYRPCVAARPSALVDPLAFRRRFDTA